MNKYIYFSIIYFMFSISSISSDGHSYLSSLHDINSPSNIKIRREKGHRLLDTLARLIKKEMKNYPGSLSLAFARDQLFIAAKRKVLPREIAEALEQVLESLRTYEVESFEQANLIKLEKKKIRSLKIRLGQSSNEDHHRKLVSDIFSARQKIDKIKLRRALAAPSSDKLSQHLSRFFGSLEYKEKIVILDNPEGLHSEMRLISHLKENNLYWQELKDGNLLKYQYIGLSMKSCGFCTGLIKGTPQVQGLNQRADENNIVFFVRSHYDSCDKTYNFPVWSFELNKEISQEVLISRLWQVNTPKANFSKANYFEMKEAELSESE